MPSVSKSQQRLMGQAYAYKTGELKSKDLNTKYADEIKDLAKSMTKKQLKDFASTKHSKLPNKIKESKIMNFESFNESNNLDIDIHGLKCDNPNCDYEDMSVPLEDYEKSIGKPCPNCGQSLLTQEDYDEVVKMIDAVDVINSFTEEDLNKIVGNLSQEEIDAALDVLNQLKMKKKGKDNDGREIWSIGENLKIKKYKDIK